MSDNCADYETKLKEFCAQFLNSNLSTNAITKSNKSDMVNIKKQILDKTKFLNKLIKPAQERFKLRLHCITNDLREVPMCKSCNTRYVKIHAAKRDRFTLFCSPACQVKGFTFDKDTVSTEIIVELRNKSYSWDAIGEMYKVNGGIIRTIAKERNIPVVNLNKAPEHVIDKLSNYDFMYHEYVTLNKTGRTIAKEIGSSGPVVHVWLAKHNIEATPSNSYPRKFAKRSKGEMSLCNLISCVTEVQHSNRTILSGLELDIVVPDAKFAIEFNGIRYHSEISGKKDKHFHSNKTKVCKEQGIELWHIFDDHWNNKIKRDIWLSRIWAKLGVSPYNIHGRKCTVQEITVQEKQTFLQAHHLQGADKSAVKLGLFHNENLVACMTFSKARFNEHYTWELSRYAVKKYHNVMGGFSKLLKHFRKMHEGSIISYADKSYSQGKVYKKNGFTLLSESDTDYFYTKHYCTRLGKRGFTKSNIKKKCEFFDPSLTEWQNMKMNGYDRVHTSGMMTFILSE